MGKKDKYSLKSLSKERLIDIIASLEWEINFWKEKEDNSRYFAKQVVEKDKEINNLKELRKLEIEDNKIVMNLYRNMYTQLQNYRSGLYGVEDIDKLRKMKLTAKEKEIYYKGFENCERQIASNLADKTIKIRHQVCEEIREYCKNNFIPTPNKLGCYVEVNREEFFNNLDQIEKGEKNETHND